MIFSPPEDDLQQITWIFTMSNSQKAEFRFDLQVLVSDMFRMWKPHTSNSENPQVVGEEVRQVKYYHGNLRYPPPNK